MPEELPDVDVPPRESACLRVVQFIMTFSRVAIAQAVHYVAVCWFAAAHYAHIRRHFS